MQMAVIEAARNLAGIEDANSTEFGPTSEPVVGLMTEWLKGNALEKRGANGDLGGTMRRVLPEIIEYADHPWFIGVQYHPELKSRPFEPHPLFASFVEAAVERSRLV
jgi:CTP synthase